MPPLESAVEGKVGKVPVTKFRPSRLLVICDRFYLQRGEPRKLSFIQGSWRRIKIMLSSAAQVNRYFRIVGRRKGRAKVMKQSKQNIFE